tara:strand:- start:1689 stop:3230 length:1542 start_codon:yes stop_codon:yes gene_type:complete
MNNSVFFAALSAQKIIGAAILSLLLLFIVFLMLRSIGIDSKTPPSMIIRKIKLFFRSVYAPITFGKKLEKAEALEDKQNMAAALEIYISAFDFDGMLSTNAKIAIINDTILEKIEEICDRTGYTYPVERINRFREDIYDYFLVRQKYISPMDYDGTPLHRAENENRFKDEIGLAQERALTDGFEQFLTGLVKKIQKHTKSSGVVILPRGQKHKADPGEVQSEMMPIEAPMSTFNNVEEESIAPPPAQEEEIADPFAGMSTDSGFGESAQGNPFAVEDPKDPFNEATGTINRLPGAEDDLAQADSAFGSLLSKKEEPIPAPPQPAGMPQPTGGFPGFGNPQPPAPAQGGFPQPTGGFPGFGNQQAPAPTPPPTGMPQPTGGFPGFGQQPPAPAQGGFPQQTPPPQAGFPQPTGGFPGFGQQPPAPTPPPAQGGFPQPTGGFPGLGQQPPAPAQGGFPQQTPPPQGGFPQPTGGFPGFGQQQPPAQQGGFPQPTGGFPGLGNPQAPNPWGDNNKK